MSTSALLILSARLRSHAAAGRVHLPASPVPSSGRRRAIGSAWASNSFRLRPFRHSGAIPPVSTLCGRRKRQAGAGLVTLPYPRAGLLACVLFLVPADGAFAQDVAQSEGLITLPTMTVEAEAGSAPRIGGPAPGPCVTVDIAGHRAGHLECATDRLQAAADTAQAQTRSAIDTPVVGAGSPDIQTGVANQTATRLRMGNALGRSVHPQRPTRPVTPPRGGF